MRLNMDLLSLGKGQVRHSSGHHPEDEQPPSVQAAVVLTHVHIERGILRGVCSSDKSGSSHRLRSLRCPMVK